MSVYRVQPNKVADLRSFLSDLNRYYHILHGAMSGEKLPKAIDKQGTELLFALNHQVGFFGQLIKELTGLATVNVHGSECDMWVVALKIPPDKLAYSALGRCLQVTTRAIGQLENDIRIGIRDRKTGKVISPMGKSKSETKTKPTSKRVPKDGEEQLMQLYNAIHLHPKVIDASRTLFKNKHYAQAIFEAYKAVENFVQDKSGETLYGTNLMGKVFNEENPIIKVPEAGHYHKDVQRGFKHLFIGAAQGIRNPKAHKEIIQKDPYITLQYLGFFSFLLKRIDYWDTDVS